VQNTADHISLIAKCTNDITFLCTIFDRFVMLRKDNSHKILTMKLNLSKWRSEMHYKCRHIIPQLITQILTCN